jgi:hypothetical protein
MRPWTPAQIETYLTGRHRDSSVATEVHRRTGGNPRLVRELADALPGLMSVRARSA